MYKKLNLLNVFHFYYGIEYNMPYCPKCGTIVPKEELCVFKCLGC